MPISILTIDPGTRYWGVSIFRGGMLFASFIKNLSAKDSTATRLPQTRKIFLSFYQRYNPKVLVIKKSGNFGPGQSEELTEIIREIRKLAEKNEMQIVELPPQTIRKMLCGHERATKEQMARAIGQFDPELRDYLLQSRECKDRYRWGRMLDSIALGICYIGRRRV